MSLETAMRVSYLARVRVPFIILLLCILTVPSCKRVEPTSSRSPFLLVGSDQNTVGHSAYPIAVDPKRVGTYYSQAKSGGGYFYDDVLEYRVWLCPDKGAADLNEGSDYYEAFAQYEQALEFAKRTRGAEVPLVLVRQLEWIEEPKPGQYIPHKDERITEWQVQWLADDKRQPNSIQEFLNHPKKIKE